MKSIMEKATIDEEIQRLTGTLTLMDPEDEGYEVVVRNLELLIRTKNSTKINKDVLLSGAINLAGMLMVLNFERIGVITSKAFSMIGKFKT